MSITMLYNKINEIKLHTTKKMAGFTLIELLIVIAIIGVLVTIVVIAVDPVRLIGEANDAKKRGELHQLKNALQLYYNDISDYPDTLDVGNLETNGYTRNLPDEYTYAGPDHADVPAGEYRAAVDLDYPITNFNDDGTYTACNIPPSSVPSGWETTYDYFICPD